MVCAQAASQRADQQEQPRRQRQEEIGNSVMLQIEVEDGGQAGGEDGRFERQDGRLSLLRPPSAGIIAYCRLVEKFFVRQPAIAAAQLLPAGLHLQGFLQVVLLALAPLRERLQLGDGPGQQLPGLLAVG